MQSKQQKKTYQIQLKVYYRYNKKILKGFNMTRGNSVNHHPYKFPNIKNGYKILEHLPFEPKTKRYVIAECPRCEEPWRTRMDALDKKNRTCKICAKKMLPKKIKTHGLSPAKGNHPIYSAWYNMKKRVKDNKWYKDILICDEWKNNFNSFQEWAFENGWKKGLELDKDVLCDKHNISPKIYSPETCLWITPNKNKEQSNFYENKIYRVIKKCNYCKKEYNGTGIQKYCSSKCRNKEVYKRRKENREI